MSVFLENHSVKIDRQTKIPTDRPTERLTDGQKNKQTHEFVSVWELLLYLCSATPLYIVVVVVGCWLVLPGAHVVPPIAHTYTCIHMHTLHHSKSLTWIPPVGTEILEVMESFGAFPRIPVCWVSPRFHCRVIKQKDLMFEWDEMSKWLLRGMLLNDDTS